MNTRLALLSIILVMMVITLGFSCPILDEEKPLTCLACDNRRVIQKNTGETFMVILSLKNTGTSEGSWSVNVAFEGEEWMWSGAPQNLTLRPYHTETLTWNGRVPDDAPLDSVSRLIVYYDSSFEALNFWIHVVEGAELEITSAKVK